MGSVSPLEGLLCQLESSCKLLGIMTASEAGYSDEDKAELKDKIKRLHDEAINAAAEALL